MLKSLVFGVVIFAFSGALLRFALDPTMAEHPQLKWCAFVGCGICVVMSVTSIAYATVLLLSHKRAPKEPRATAAPVRRAEPEPDPQPEPIAVESGKTVVLHMRDRDGKAMGFRVRNATDEGVRKQVLRLKSKGYDFIRTVEE